MLSGKLDWTKEGAGWGFGQERRVVRGIGTGCGEDWRGHFQGKRKKRIMSGELAGKGPLCREMDRNRILSWEKRDCQGNWKGTKREISKRGVKEKSG